MLLSAPVLDLAKLISVEIKHWLKGASLQLFHDPGSVQPATIDSSHYAGRWISVANFSSVGIDRLLFRCHPDKLCLVFAEHGQCRGQAGGRIFRFLPQRFAFLLLPAEVLQVLKVAPRSGGLILQIPVDILRHECELHHIDHPDLITLQESVPGHEPLLIACARQLLELAKTPEGPGRERISQPLECSILSLVANLVGSRDPSLPQSNPTHPQDLHVQNAMAFFEKNISVTITLTDVCQACNISARTLQSAFQAVVNLSPVQALHELRLTRLRQELLRGVDVRSACVQVGLPFSGRIAASYRRRFGEPPSQTRMKARADSNSGMAELDGAGDLS